MLSPRAILQRSPDSEAETGWHIRRPRRGRSVPPRKRPLQVKKKVQHHQSHRQKMKGALLAKPLPPPTLSPKNESYLPTPRRANHMPKRPKGKRRRRIRKLARSSPPRTTCWPTSMRMRPAENKLDEPEDLRR